MLLFLDLETTGFDPQLDQVLEVGAVLVNDDFTAPACLEDRTFECVLQLQKRSTPTLIDPIVVEMHTRNGLWCEVFNSPLSVAAADDKLATWLASWKECSGENVYLAGNSIHFDRSFMTVHMPKSLVLLHYRQLDVSSINELAKRCCPRAYETRPTPGKVHRAMADALESWATAVHYAGIFKGVVP